MLRTAIAFAAVAAVGRVAAARPRKYNTNAKRSDAPGVLNVHVIPHTHDDVGWLKTVDEYYGGLNNTIQHASVRHILTSTVDSLLLIPDRKFIYVEQAYFQRWWAEQDAVRQAAVQGLVAEGRLSFVNGGWSMPGIAANHFALVTMQHDEATTVYSDMIDNTQLGHRYIASQFGQGALPEVTWQIDPFGHSGAQASLLSSPAAGFSALFVSRADYADIAARTRNRSLEYVWTPSSSLGDGASTFFSIMNSGLHLYFPLPGLCWDIVNCNDPEIQDDPALDDYNVPALVDLVVSSARGAAENYIGDVYFTQGFDFNFEYAEEWFANLDRMIHYTNLNTSVHGVNLFYSTPQAYARTKLAYPYAWPAKGVDDGFPYADGPHSYWTGFFTSRPALKGYVRDSGSYFQAAKQIQALTAPVGDLDAANPLLALSHAMAVVQHHDAVAGTAMQHVSDDYAKRLARGRLAADAFLATAVPSLLGAPAGTAAFTCDLAANASICGALEAASAGDAPFTVFVYNSQSQAKSALPVRIPVGAAGGGATWAVYAGLPADGKPVAAQTVPLSPADAALRNGYYSWPSPAAQVQWCVFLADVPAVGLAAYTLVPVAAAGDAPLTVASTVVAMGAGGGSLSNGLLTLAISNATGLVGHYSAPAAGIDTPLAQSWLWYNASVGNDVDSQASGAYIFRPNSSSPFPVGDDGAAGKAAAVTLVTGPLVSEAWSEVAPWLSQVTRLWADGRGDSFDVEYTVGPVPFAADLWGKEVVTRYSAPALATAGAWATDSNGRDMYVRARSKRPAWWNDTIAEPVAANYYPVNTAIQAKVCLPFNLLLWAVTDHSATAPSFKRLPFACRTLWAVTVRSQGGASIVDGSVELMVHRRLQHDDGRGVGEPLNETGLGGGAGLVVRGTHRVGMAQLPAAAAARRAAVADVSLFRPLLTYARPAPAALAAAATSALAAALPANVHLLSLQSLAAGPPASFIVRLAHSFGAGEDAALSANATVDLATLLPALPFARCDEATLPGGQPLASAPAVEMRRQQPAGGAHALLRLPLLPAASDPAAPTVAMVGGMPQLVAMPVTLSPLQIRTFVCTRSG